jgi:hypothetical protein
VEPRSESGRSDDKDKDMPIEQEQPALSEYGSNDASSNDGMQGSPDADASGLRDPKGVQYLVTQCLLSPTQDNPLKKFTPDLPYLIECAIDIDGESPGDKQNRVLAMEIQNFAEVGIRGK